MSLGASIVTIQPGGGQQAPSAAELARSIVGVGCSPLLAANTLAQIGDPSAIPGILDSGTLAEYIALTSRQGQTRLALGVNPSQVGAVGTVGQTGIGTGVITAAAAPHKLVEIQISLAGTVGTMAFKWRVGGVGSFSAAVTSTGSSFVFRVPGTYCVLTFAAGTYVLNSTYAFGTDNSVTLGGSAINTVTAASSPIDAYEFVCTVAKAGILGTAVLGLSVDNGNGSLPSVLMPTNGTVVVPGTGIVITCGQHVVVLTITTPGALGTAIYSYAVDGGSAVTGQATTPNSGGNYVVTISGITFTFAPGTYVGSSTYTDSALGVITIGGGGINTVTQAWAGFVGGDKYSFLTAGPTGSTADYTAALDVLRLITPLSASLIHIVDFPSTAAGAFALAAALESELETAFANNGRDWQGACDCPSSIAGGGLGDIVVSGGLAIRDTADTDAVIKAARGADTPRVAFHAGTERMASKLTTGRFPLRPISWFAANRYVDTDPKRDLGARGDGPLPVFVPAGQSSTVGPIGRDERKTPGLDDVQINTLQTDPNLPGVYFSLTAGVAAWKNMTTQVNFQVASALRVLNSALPALRAVGARLLGEDADVKLDGTITENQAIAWDMLADNAFKRGTGLLAGGDFAVPQASVATGKILRSSQLGQSPKRLDIQYTFQPRGEVTNVSSAVRFSGVLSILSN